MKRTITKRTNKKTVVTTDVNDYPVALVVGAYYRSDRPSVSGFVYDVFANTIDPDPDPDNPKYFWDVEELVGNDPPAGAPVGRSTVVSSFRGANSAGLISGYVEDPYGIEQAVYLDLDLDNPDAAGYELVMIPRPEGDDGSADGSGYCRGRDVTELGDILVTYWSDLPAKYRAYVYNAYNPSGPEYIASIASEGEPPEPILFSSNFIYLNSWRQVVGKRADDMIIRHSMPTGSDPPVTEEFSGLYGWGELNYWGQFVATANNIRGKHRYAARVGPPKVNGEAVYEWTAAETITYGHYINFEGDVLFDDSWAGGEDFYYHDGLDESFNLKDLVIAGSDPEFLFRDQDDGYGKIRVSDRDFTGFGWVAKSLRVTDPVDESQEWHLALLIPEIVLPPTTSTYNSDAVNLDIPDNNSDGVESWIYDVGNHDPVTVTVTLNITHPRPSDLQAFVTGPDGTERELSTIPGDNDLTGLISNTEGDWKLEVYDTRKKKTGTLNSWSITIDY